MDNDSNVDAAFFLLLAATTERGKQSCSYAIRISETLYKAICYPGLCTYKLHYNMLVILE